MDKAIKENIKKLVLNDVDIKDAFMVLGLTPSEEREILHDEDLVREIKSEILAKRARIVTTDEMWDEIENTGTKLLLEQVPYMDTNKLLATIKIANNAKRHSRINGIGSSELNTGAIAEEIIELDIDHSKVQLSEHIVINEKSQITNIDGRSMTTISMKQLEEITDGKDEKE